MESASREAGLSSVESEERFRQIFFTHLESDGFSQPEAHRLIFKTPESFHRAPSGKHGLELLDAFRQRYERQLPYSWYFEGLNREPESDRQFLQAPERPVAFVVIPGIFGEFIESIPFQSVVDEKDSHFCRTWQKALEDTTHRVYSLLELSEVPCTLADLVKIGSLDQGERSFANVIILRAKGGSLESLGTLASNVDVVSRRLTQVFEVITPDTDIYLVGYSRGLTVALELISRLHEQTKRGTIPSPTRAWFERVKGVVGLGGVYYGANFAHDVLTGKSVPSELLGLLSETSEKLATIPKGTRERSRLVADNAKTWAKFLRGISAAGVPRVAAGRHFLQMDLHEMFARESKARILDHHVPIPNQWGIFNLVNAFFLSTFNLRLFASRYNENIQAFRTLVEAVMSGLDTLTPESRDTWWRTHELPKDIALFSITGTMPEAYLDNFESPLSRFPGFGVKTSDYNASLRASYYDVLSSENTLINDSQMSHFCSRYWEEMYPEHQHAHYYLGVLGTHHWGMAFPFAIKDPRNIGENAFPRSTLLKSIASFIASL